MKTARPRLASGERVADSEATPAFASAGPEIEAVHNPGARAAKHVSRSIAGFVAAGMLMLFLTYVVLSATVMVFMRADGETVAVLRNTFPVGQAPPGAVVYASSAPVDGSFTSKVEQAIGGVPAGSVVEIVAGPAAVISADVDGRIVADGQATDYSGVVADQSLDRAYIAICLAGSCTKDAAVIVGQDNIVGEVKGYLGFTGLTSPPSAETSRTTDPATTPASEEEP